MGGTVSQLTTNALKVGFHHLIHILVRKDRDAMMILTHCDTNLWYNALLNNENYLREFQDRYVDIVKQGKTKV